jgi:hypothetical protein
VQTLGGIAANQKITIVEHQPTDVETGPVHGRQVAEVALYGGAPNPFRDASTISYSLPARVDVELRVVDVRGRVVRTLESGAKEAGEHRVEWNGRG